MITTAAGIHTAVLFQLKARPADFPDTTSVSVKYYGYASDGNTGNENWGLTAFVYKKVNGIWTWVEMGTNTATELTDKNLTLIQHDFLIGDTYRDTSENVSILATSTYADTAATDVTSYYVSLEDTLPSGVHTGGCADIYINDPSRILTAENILNNITGDIELSTANGFLGPLHSIVRVERSLMGDDLKINTDWSLVSGSPSKAFSIYEYPYLTFSPALIDFKVRIVYRYYHDGPDVQALLDSDEYRFGGVDNLAKILPPTIVTINTLDYKGTPTVEEIVGALKAYINAATTLTLADLINLLYTYGVTWIDIPNIDISIVAHDYKRVISDPITLTDSYTISGLTVFFVDDASLVAIRRL
jgi:hypothetical protein